MASIHKRSWENKRFYFCDENKLAEILIEFTSAHFILHVFLQKVVKTKFKLIWKWRSFQAIRRALYQDNTAPNPSGCGTSELDTSVQIDSHFGMSARTAAKMVITHAPSDISSIQGDLTDLTERDCQTPTSDISVESEEKPVNQVEQNQVILRPRNRGSTTCAQILTQDPR